jgi:hypothetical protein
VLDRMYKRRQKPDLRPKRVLAKGLFLSRVKREPRNAQLEIERAGHDVAKFC